MRGHVRNNLFSNFLVKAAERNGTNRDRRFKSQSSQKTSSFQGNIRRAHAQRLTRRFREREDIIRSDAALLRTRRVWVRWAPTDGDDDFVRRDDLFSAVLLRRHHCVRILKRTVSIQIGHIRLSQRRAVAKVQRTDVVLHLFHHLLPVVPSALELPSVLSRVTELLTEDSCLMHQLFRNASNVHARTTESPSSPGWRRLYEIQTRRLRPELRRLLRRC
mmetsp:Transcript_7932/g.17859  ORF Transcript_7932/g.17859 Transcript_7932/m.17859 type:complete len:218 (-) Transcript_7932:289-942(-)